MRYNKYDEAYMVISHFNLGLEHYTRVRFMKTGEEEVFLTKDVKTGDFHSKNYKVADAVESYKIQATSPKGEALLVESDGLEAFANTYKLEIEAVKACIAGKQKTHRRWGFVKVD